MAAVRGQDAVASQDLWYHTIEVAPGVVTPGWFDLRPVMKHIPWPDVRGKRCLDIATYDGFLAFELERRGAAEVWATDLPNHEDWDWLPRDRAQGVAYLDAIAGQKGRGFEIAAELLDSKVQRRFMSVYQLDPDEIGQFDVVVCGSLMLHLRDPVRAIETIRSVCDGWFLSVEQVSLVFSKVFRKRPLAELRSGDERCQWWVVNTAGHRRIVETAGFDVVDQTGPFLERFGKGHPNHSAASKVPAASELARRMLRGGRGVPHAALLARAA